MTVCPHLLASYLAWKGGPAVTVQAILGHASISMTYAYYIKNVNDPRMVAFMDAMMDDCVAWAHARVPSHLSSLTNRPTVSSSIVQKACLATIDAIRWANEIDLVSREHAAFQKGSANARASACSPQAISGTARTSGFS